MENLHIFQFAQFHTFKFSIMARSFVVWLRYLKGKFRKWLKISWLMKNIIFLLNLLATIDHHSNPFVNLTKSDHYSEPRMKCIHHCVIEFTYSNCCLFFVQVTAKNHNELYCTIFLPTYQQNSNWKRLNRKKIKACNLCTNNFPTIFQTYVTQFFMLYHFSLLCP